MVFRIWTCLALTRLSTEVVCRYCADDPNSDKQFIFALRFDGIDTRTIPLKLSKEYFYCRPLPRLLMRKINLIMWDDIVRCNIRLRWRWFIEAIVNQTELSDKNTWLKWELHYCNRPSVKNLNSTGISRFPYPSHHLPLLPAAFHKKCRKTKKLGLFYDVASNAP